MAETHHIITKVWIAPGCIVCDACENDCPEVFDVQEETCLIRPPAMKADFLKPLTPSIIVAAEGCPVEVIKYETKEVPGTAPWADQPAPVAAAAAAGHGEVVAKAPAAKPAAPLGAARSALAGAAIHEQDQPLALGESGQHRSTQLRGQPGRDMHPGRRRLPKTRRPISASRCWRSAGRIMPSRRWASAFATGRRAQARRKFQRRSFNFALAIGWGLVAFVGATFGAMFQDFFGPKVLKEPRKVLRVGEGGGLRKSGRRTKSYKPDGHLDGEPPARPRNG